MVDEDYELAEIPELYFSIDKVSFWMPHPFKIEIYGECGNQVEISILNNDPNLIGKLNIISALSDAFIHNIPCQITVRFVSASLRRFDETSPIGTPPFIFSSPNPTPDSFMNYWSLIGIGFKKQ